MWNEIKKNHIYLFQRNNIDDLIEIEYFGEVIKKGEDYIYFTPLFFVKGYGSNDIRRFEKKSFERLYILKKIKYNDKSKEDYPEYFI